MGKSPVIPAKWRRLYRGSRCLLLSVIILAIPAFALGQGGQAIGDALAQCAELTDGGERLACFDRVAAGDDDNAQAVESTVIAPARESDTYISPVESVNASKLGIDNNVDPAAQEAGSTSIGNNESVDHSAPADAEAVPVISATPRPNAPTAKKETANIPPAVAAPAREAAKAAAPIALGDRSMGAVAEVPAEPSELAASVERIARQPRGEHVVFLDNEQVWVQEFKDSYFPIEVGDAVTIKKRRFGGYRLMTESGKAYRVKRLR